MELYLAPIATIAVLFFFACASPGPDFINITSYALASRRAGLAAAAGAALGVMILSSAISVGLSMTASGFTPLYYVLRVLGAFYLAYLGCKAIIGALRGGEPPLKVTQTMPVRIVFARGFATNLANPKAAFFIASIFTTTLPSSAPALIHFMAVLVVTIIACAVYAGVAITFSLGKVQSFYRRAWRSIDTLLGACFIGIASKLALQR